MEKYLRHYAEPVVAALDGLPDVLTWENVLVIPACNETSAFLRQPPACDGRSLMILVINEPVTAQREVTLANLALAADVRERFKLQWQSAACSGLSLWQDPFARRDVLLVDCFSEGRQIPVKGGVGQARKIGADLAVSLIHRKRVHTDWIHCSDADVQLPETYFTRGRKLQSRDSKYSALIYPFSHCDDPGRAESGEVILATRLYELSLRYYVAGMNFAGSPYAFHTIGSTMAVSPVHYAKVRGFPKREAGEDFYLLNKLAKVGTVLELGQETADDVIIIESRRSDRVPFGTGAAVNKITDLADPVGDYQFYDPAVFVLLSLWLQSLPAVWQSGDSDLNIDIFSDGSGDHIPLDKRQALLDCLKEIKIEKALGHAFRQGKSLEQFTRQVHTWFDAFRTLKLIHGLRDLLLPSISYAMLESHPVFSGLLARDPDLLAFHEQLRKNSVAETTEDMKHREFDPTA